MSRRCVLCNAKKNDETTLHTFPKEPTLLGKWKKACEFADYDNVSTLSICSAHFEPGDLNEYMSSRPGKFPTVIKRLRPYAVPSVNVPYSGESTSSLTAPPEIVLEESQTETVEGPTKKQKINEKCFEAVTEAVIDQDQSSTSMSKEIIEVSAPKSSETIKVDESEVATPKQARNALYHARFIQSQLRRKIIKLQQDKRRLTSRISKLQDVVEVLIKGAIVSEESLETC